MLIELLVVRTLASALTMYMSHYRAFPPSGAEAPGGQCDGSGLTALTVQQTSSFGLAGGPFLAALPTQPLDWTPYASGYVGNVVNGTYSITTSGDGVVVTVP